MKIAAQQAQQLLSWKKDHTKTLHMLTLLPGRLTVCPSTVPLEMAPFVRGCLQFFAGGVGCHSPEFGTFKDAKKHAVVVSRSVEVSKRVSPESSEIDTVVAR